MRDIPDELVARIESGAATLCHAWTVTRADGVRMGFCDHDRDLELDGVLCTAGGGWTMGAMEGSAGLTGGTLAVAGVLDDDRIAESDVEAGLWDRAQVEVWRVDWARPYLKVRLSVGRLSRIRREGAGFTAEVEGPLAALERVVGRTYGRSCDAVLGDHRCRIGPAGRTCDKRWETCVGVFGNGINFQGFPGIPGDDFLTAYPTTGGRNDGARR